ncbi:metallophosphoesterase [Prosthecomicrobium sp. N25]|uniref:metallophosphoesterase n=1 Tax=Prosthecomicrobium sp. N25 TaxID=3129254 RepID=UPI003076CC06
MISRRRFLQGLATSTTAFLSLGGYAVGWEPRHRLEVTRYDLRLPRWPADAPPLTVALIADLHAVDPWMPVSRIAEIVRVTNELKPDLILLLGDYVGTMRFANRVLEPREWAAPLAALRAPLGAYAILGNHDWWWLGNPEPVRRALEHVGIPVLVNRALRLRKGPHDLWVSGTDSMIAEVGAGGFLSRADLDKALSGIDGGAPVIHMAHEPDLFVGIPDRVALTVSGHTHGGQVRMPVVGPLVVPSSYGRRFAYGHVREGGRHLLVSGGLGCSTLPIRFLAPPEVVLARLSSDITPQTPVVG